MQATAGGQMTSGSGVGAPAAGSYLLGPAGAGGVGLELVAGGGAGGGAGGTGGCTDGSSTRPQVVPEAAVPGSTGGSRGHSRRRTEAGPTKVK